MMNLFVIVLLGILTASPIRASIADLQAEPPVLKIYEVDDSNNIIKLYHLADTVSSGVIIENTDHIRLECQAYYPVQWVYTGSGVPILSSNIEISKTAEKNVNQYTANAFLSPLNERHTGSYRCSHTESLTLLPLLHIYVPGKNLFTSLGGKTIQVLHTETSILIPCSVSHPSVKVSLRKLTKTGLEEPATKSDDAIKYLPREGFRINLNEIVDLDGEYVCLATYKDIAKAVDYKIVSESTEKFGEFNQSPEETCIGESCASRCETHEDCPSEMHCYTDRLCRDPCIYSIRCGREALCRLIDNAPVCYCPPGFAGDATKECFNS